MGVLLFEQGIAQNTTRLYLGTFACAQTPTKCPKHRAAAKWNPEVRPLVLLTEVPFMVPRYKRRKTIHPSDTIFAGSTDTPKAPPPTGAGGLPRAQMRRCGSPSFYTRVAVFRSLFRLERCGRRLGFCGLALGTGRCLGKVICETRRVVPSPLTVRGDSSRRRQPETHCTRRIAGLLTQPRRSCRLARAASHPRTPSTTYTSATVLMSPRGRANRWVDQCLRQRHT